MYHIYFFEDKGRICWLCFKDWRYLQGLRLLPLGNSFLLTHLTHCHRLQGFSRLFLSSVLLWLSWVMPVNEWFRLRGPRPGGSVGVLRDKAGYLLLLSCYRPLYTAHPCTCIVVKLHRKFENVVMAFILVNDYIASLWLLFLLCGDNWSSVWRGSDCLTLFAQSHYQHWAGAALTLCSVSANILCRICFVIFQWTSDHYGPHGPASQLHSGSHRGPGGGWTRAGDAGGDDNQCTIGNFAGLGRHYFKSILRYFIFLYPFTGILMLGNIHLFTIYP